MAPKILIVTNGPLSRNPRVMKEAMTLGSAGYVVTVLGVRNHVASVASDAALTRGAPFAHRQINLLGDETALSARMRVWFHRLRIRLARDAARRLGITSIAALGPHRALYAEARALPSDLIIVHNEVPHWIGARLLDQGRRVAADVEDWHSEDLLPSERRHRPLALIRAVEAKLLHHAAHVTTTSDSLATALHARYGGNRPGVVTNSFPLPILPHRTGPQTPPAFFWFSQTLGPGRGLEEFLATWQLCRQPSRLVLLGEAYGGYDQALLATLPAPRRAWVQFLSPVPPPALPDVISQHDVGLALEDSAIVNRDLTITNKILQYLGAGLAVVATPTAGQHEVLSRSPEAGLLLDFKSPARDAAALDQLIVDRAQLSARQRAARLLAESHYCWEREAPRLLEMVSRALEAPIHRAFVAS